MTFYQLRYFLTLAETLNYTKASQKLHITQPNLSKMIVNLEQEIGVQLFLRSKRNVRLTAAGQAFYEKASISLKAYENAVETARNIADGVTGKIEIGFLGTAMVHRMPALVKQFRREHPEIELHLTDYTYSPLLQDLLDDKLDIALLPDKELKGNPSISSKLLYADTMCAVLPRSHHLAGEEEIEVTQLRNEPFVMMNPAVSIWDVNLVTNICLEQGFSPDISDQANSLNNLMMLVECELGVYILAEHMSRYATKDLTFVRLKGYQHYFRIVAAWREGRNPAISNFLALLD